MRKEGYVEIKRVATGFCPIDPTAKILGGLQISLGRAGLTVHGVQVHARLCGRERECGINIHAHLVAVSCAAGIIARDKILGMHALVLLKSYHVVALPVVQRDRNGLKNLNGSIGVHTVCGVNLFGVLIGAQNLLGISFHG